MPSWEGRFSPGVIKALAVYVHVNAGGGEASGAAATAP
jgi:cytochrome c oxidase cbb3-type subunit 3